MKKEGLAVILVLASVIFFSSAAFAEDQLVMKFHAEGDGKNASVNLTKFFPGVQQIYHSNVQNVTITIDNGIVTIIPLPGWKGDELIIFSPNASLVNFLDNTNLNITNIEPVIEMSFPDVKNFGATAGEIDFSVAVFDPDNDFLDIEWFVNGEPMKKERAKGGGISKFTFNQTGTGAGGGIIRDYNFTHEKKEYMVTVIINDSKNIKVNEWHFNVLNVSCIDTWKCENWSDCIEGKHYRDCVKTSPQCKLNFNRPSTEWIDPNCAVPRFCETNWSCGEWGPCTINYNSQIISRGNISDAISTKQERMCYDTTYCVGSVGIERRPCNESVPIRAKNVEWCFERYIEIYNADDGLLLSRIRQSKSVNQGLDIDISLGDLSRVKICWYCFNGIKDYDETDVDCGGSCDDCTPKEILPKYSFVDYKTAVFLFADIVLLFLFFRFIKKP